MVGERARSTGCVRGDGMPGNHPHTDEAMGHEAPMSGSDVSGAKLSGERDGGVNVVMLAVSFFSISLLLFGFMVLSDSQSIVGLWRDLQCPVLGCAVLQLVMLLVCLVGHLSPSSSGAVRRRYGGLLLLAVTAGSHLPAAGAVSQQLDTAVDEMVGDMSQWILQSQQELKSPSSRLALENQTYKTSGALAEGLLPKGSPPDASSLSQRAAARKLLQWPSGVSDADRSPTPDPGFLHKEEKLVQMSKRMEAGLERSAKEQEHMDSEVKKLQDSIFDDIGDVKTDVFKENKELTDDIDNVEPVQGAPGPPGQEGPHGINGINGIHGAIGLQGQRGKRGIAGPQGKVGVMGPQGKEGPLGKFGLQGEVGPEGKGGGRGQVGEEGLTAGFQSNKYFCPEGKTETMMLTGCTKRGCRLEVKFEDDWGTVCSAGFTDQSAVTLCQAMGFEFGGVAVKNFGGGKGQIWLEQVKCTGDEGDAGDCQHSPWGETYCQHSMDVGMCCNGGRPTGKIGKREGPSFFPRCPPKANKDMRMVDCNREVCRLEVMHDGLWGSVCDNGFTDKSAKTVCNVFGYPGYKFKQMCATEGKYGRCQANYRGKGPIWLDDVVCSGYERDLAGCRHKGWGNHRCSHKQDVGICCSGEEGDVEPLYSSPPPVKGGPGSPMIYKFNEALGSATGGPGLAAPWGGQYTAEGFRFKKGQGLVMDPSGFVPPHDYTFFWKLKLDSVRGQHMLLRSNGWAQNGFLVIDGHFQAFPNNENGTLWCEEEIKPDKWYYYIVQYTEQGMVKLYLNGGLCAHGKEDEPNTFSLNPAQVMIMSDTGKRLSSGTLNKFMAFGKVISEKKAARICECKLPKRDGPCIAGDDKIRHIIINAALSGIKYSSVYTKGWEYCSHQGGNCNCDGTVRYGHNGLWATKKTSGVVNCNDDIFGDPAIGVRKHCECKKSTRFGRGFSAGRLNSPQAWTPMQSMVGEWFQMDSGSVQSIAGVATQGRRDVPEWVTVFSVKVSEDGKKWRWVECGRPYYGNTNHNTRKKIYFHEPVHGRFIRIYPLEWMGRLSMRAGIIVCELPSIGGQLDYQFSLSFTSSTQGPALDPAWGEGDWKEISMDGRPTTVYKFEEGQGLMIDHWCLKVGKQCMPWLLEYTVYIQVKMDDVIGYRRIFGSQIWGDYGLYVNRYLMMVPSSTRMKCHEIIRTKKFYQFVMTRDKKGVVKLYVNGDLCAEGNPPYKDHFRLNPNDMMIMKDNYNEDSGGEIANFHIWDKALVKEDVELVCGCHKPEPGEPCKFTVAYNPPTSKMHYSSVRNNDKKGKGFARGRLGSKVGWVAQRAEIGEYIQVDSGMVQSIAGVVTQGRKDQDEWVTTFTIQVSKDGSQWYDVNCGQEWDANTNRNAKVRTYFSEPVKARYLRLYPEEWHNWISMRMALLICEKPCVENRVDYDFVGSFASRTFGPSLSPAWGEGEFDGLDGYVFDAGAGMEVDASRCLKNPEGWTMVMNVKLDKVLGGLKALMTTMFWGQDNGLYVGGQENAFLRLLPSGSNMVCEQRPIVADESYYFAITRTAQGNITLYVDGARCATGNPPFFDKYALRPQDIYFFHDDKGQEAGGVVKSIGMWNKHMTDKQMAGHMGCLLPEVALKPCALGHIAFSPASKNMKFSSFMKGQTSGRLNSLSAWSPKRPQVGEWLQMDTGSLQVIAGVVTQGSRTNSHWVTSFIVKVSKDGRQWKDVECQRRWKGNKNQNSKLMTFFPDPVVARYIRLYPTTWQGWPSMRAGTLICEMPCVEGRLDYDLLEGSMLSITQGPALEAEWGPGWFAGDEGYRFPAGMGLILDQDDEGCMNDHLPTNSTHPANEAYTILFEAKFDTPEGWRNLIRSRGWSDYGLYVNNFIQLFPTGANMKCEERIDANKYYNIGMTRSTDGIIRLYINGFECAKGTPTYARGYSLNQHDIEFFHDEGSENTAGYVKRIRMWNKQLPPSKMAKIAGCRLTENAERCKVNIVFTPAAKLTKYSSIYNNDRPGLGHGRGRLNSAAAWSPADRVMGTQFMQIDTTEVQSIAGVVVQGRRDANQWVTRLTLQVSQDGEEWTDVQCGMVFEANNNRNTKKNIYFRTPVKARYVRFFPAAYHEWPSMRAAVLICERPCINHMLDYRFDYSFLSSTKGPSLDPAWGEGEFEEGGVGYQFGNNQGLIVDESSSDCIINPDNYTLFIEARVTQPSGWRKLFGSESWGEYGAYVNDRYMLYPRAAGMQCLERIRPDRYYKFMMSRNEKGGVKLYLNGYKCADAVPPFVSGYRPSPSSLEFFHSENGKSSPGFVKRITFWNKVFTDEEAATESECRLSTLGSKCPMGDIIELAPYDRMEYSSTLYNHQKGTGYGKGRLGSTTAWCAGSYEGAWLQIDTGEVQDITGIVTQGRGDGWGWVTTLKAMVSDDGLKFTDVQCGSVLNANTDMNTLVKNYFDVPVRARYVRIFPEEYSHLMCMRAGILTCQRKCKGQQLDYEFISNFDSTTLGPDMFPVWGFGQFTDTGYRFWNGYGLQLNEKNCISGSGAWTIMLNIKFDNVYQQLQRILDSEGWGDYGLFLRRDQLEILPSGADLTCKALIQANEWYYLTMSRSAKGVVTIYVNGYPCASRTPPYLRGFALDDVVSFLRDPNSAQNPTGYVKRIRMWGRQLEDGEVAAISGCVLQTPSKEKCDEVSSVSPRYQNIKFSSVWGNDRIGYGHGRGRLNSPQAWSVAWGTGKGEWMQMDLQEVVTVPGVVTQGRYEWWHAQWVTQFKVMTSVDNKKWEFVECARTFKGNTDSNTKVVNRFENPITARYVRIIVEQWSNWPSMRAGVLVCDRPCIKGEMKYTFDGSFLSDTQGPSLDPAWGEGEFSDTERAYYFNPGQGLMLKETACFKDSQQWTWAIRVKMLRTNGWVRLMNSNWGDFGLYIHDGRYEVFPSSANMKCKGQVVDPKEYYWFGMTRSEKGEITLYLNGFPCIQGKPALADRFKLGPEITFFRDDGNENGNGYVKQIRLVDKALDKAAMQSMSGCDLPKEAKKCDRTVIYNAPYSRIFFSSTLYSDRNGYRYGSGRLNAQYGWIAASPTDGQFMQFDLRKVQTVAGVVTQGRQDWYEWVTAFAVTVSEDGETWTDVQCGNWFPGNTDKDTKLKTLFPTPVKAQYVKISPKRWSGYWVTMRAGVLLCETKCIDGELDYPLADELASDTDGPSLEPVWGDGQFVSTQFWTNQGLQEESGYRFAAGQGFEIDPSSCIKSVKAYSTLIEVSFDDANRWNRVLGSESWRRNGVFVYKNKYMVSPEDLEIVCPNYIFNRRKYLFGFVRTAKDKVKLYVNGYMCVEGDASDTPKGMVMDKEEFYFFRDPNNQNGPGVVSRIRAWNKALGDGDMLKECGCKMTEPFSGTCSSQIVVNVPYSRMKASATWGNDQIGSGWARGKLNSGGGWIAPSYNIGNWLQMDTGEVQGIAGVVTQGGTLGWWTTAFYVMVSSDGKKWRKVECGRTFQGNVNYVDKLVTKFQGVVKARYVRIFPEESHGYPTLRAGVLVCETRCKDKNLNYMFDDSLSSKTGGPNLETPWGEGEFVKEDRCYWDSYWSDPQPCVGYRFQKDQGMQLDEQNCIKDTSKYSVLMEVRLDETSSWRALMTSEEWGDNGLYVGDDRFRMKPSEIICSETIRKGYWYKFGMTRTAKGVVTLFINGYPCASGKPSSSNGFKLVKDDMIFLRGQSSQSSAGYIKKLEIWGEPLDDTEMTDKSGCVTLAQEKACASTVAKTPTLMRFRASSIYSGDWGGYYANPMLNSIDGWWMAHGDKKRWLQMDLGKVENVQGVITQGSRYQWYFVTSYRVKVSEDAKKWKWVECGRYFEGNVNNDGKVQNLFDAPVSARYVRIYADKYTNWVVMRAAAVLCESECKEKKLMYKLTGENFQSSTGGPNLIASWGENQNGFSPVTGYRFEKDKGLSVDGSRCFNKPKEYSMIIEAKLDSTNEWRNLWTSEEWQDNGLYIHQDKYTLRPSKLECSEIIRNLYYYKFGITRAKDGTISLYINGYLCASGKPASQGGYELATDSLMFFHGPTQQSSAGYVKSIQIWGKTLSEDDMLTECGCTLPPTEKACAATVIKNPDIDAYKASTTWWGDMGTYYVNPQLMSLNGWWARTADQKQWLQIDMGKVQAIAGVVTQGSSNHGYWVTSYKVSVSKDGKRFEFVQCGQVFDGNTNYGNTQVKNLFDLPVEGRYIRIHPMTWWGHIVMRAGGIICETKCKSGQLDWSFDGTFESRTGGPSLDPAWGEGTFEKEPVYKPFQALQYTGYKFQQGYGFKVDETRCIETPKHYAILVDVSLDKTDSWRGLLTTDNWQGNGLFVNNNYQLRPTTMVCEEEPIRPGRYYKFGMTRTDEGEVKLFLNGYLCATGKPKSADGFKLDTEEAVFLRGPHGASSPGYVKRIQVWDEKLDDDAMLEASGCVLPAQTAMCNKTIVYAPDYSKYRADSIRWNQAMGYYYFGRPDLNAQYGWQPYNQPTWGVPWVADNTGAWLQIDLDKTQAVYGLVTRGDGYNGYYVKTYKVRVSTNAKDWQDVECGRIFDGNVNYADKATATFRKPVKARYVRIYPESGVYIGLRAGVIICEPECQSGELDYKLTTASLASITSGASLDPAWGDGTFQDQQGYRFNKNQGLELDQTGCLKNIKQYSMLINVRLDEVDKSRAIFTSPDWNKNNDGVFVTDGIVELKPTDLSCQEKILQNHYYQIGLARDMKSGNVTLSLNGYPCAMGNPASSKGFELGKSGMRFLRGPTDQSASGYVKQIRMWSKYFDDEAMEEKAGCVLAPQTTSCTKTTVYAPDVSKYRVSSVAYSRPLGDYWFGRPDLNAQYGWAPATWRYGTFTDKPEWVQIDVGRVAIVSGVVVRGNRYFHYWTTTYQVEVSDDARKWKQVECGRIFPGSKNVYSKVSAFFDKPVKARYVRIYPESSTQTYMGMTAGLLLCEEMCEGGVLDYRLTSESFSSVTLGASLDTPWGEDGCQFDGNNGYRFAFDKGFSVDQRMCLSDRKKWTFFIDLKVDQVDKRRAILTSEGWNAGSDGLFIKDGLLTILPSGLQCNETLYPNYYYKIGITRADGSVALYINGYQCAERKVTSDEGFALPKEEQLWMVHGANGMSPVGNVLAIRLYKKTFTADEMKSMAGCNLPTMGEKCTTTVEFAPGWEAYRSSSNVYNLGMGHYHYTRPDIAGYYGWKPYYQTWEQPWFGRNKRGGANSEWLQVDMGKKQMVAGITSHGDRLWGYYVTSYIVMVSNDASSWTSVECGRVFPGNKNYWDLATTYFDWPVEARYVRIYPVTGVYIGLSFSLQLCESKCENKQLKYNLQSSLSSTTDGISLIPKWGQIQNPIQQINNFEYYHGEKQRFEQGYRLERGQGFSLKQADCLKTDSSYTLIIKARFDNVGSSDKDWYALFTSNAWANGVNGLYIHNGRLQLRPTDLKCKDYLIKSRRDYTFVMTRYDGTVTLYINGYPCAQGKPTESNGFELDNTDGMKLFKGTDEKESPNAWIYRVELMAKALDAKQVMQTCEEGGEQTSNQHTCLLPKTTDDTCDKTVVKAVGNLDFSASSILGGYRMGQWYARPKLNGWHAWCPWWVNRDQWLQMDLQQSKVVYGVVTQGRGDAWQWVNDYFVTISDDGNVWKDVECGRVFVANKDNNGKVQNLFENPVKARYIRIHPVSYTNYMCMRAGLILCESKCKDHVLKYEMQSFDSSTGGPQLDAPWGEGDFEGPVSKGVDHYGDDLGYQHNMAFDDCKKACESTPGCNGYGTNVNAGSGCWLKSKMSKYSRNANPGIDSYYLVNTLYYTMRAPIGYIFRQNEGLSLEQGPCIDSVTEYTVLVTVRLDYTDGNRRIMSSQSWGDAGLYVKDKTFKMYPSVGGMSCDGLKIKQNYNYMYGISRAKDGTVKLFLNGIKCAEGKPAPQKGFELSKEGMTFFRDTNYWFASGGVVRNIKMWSKTLDESAIAAEASCKLLNTTGATCSAEMKRTYTADDKPYKMFKATRNDVDFSSVWQRNDYGEGWGRGYNVWMQGDWLSDRGSTFGEWQQIDLREQRSVSGLVMSIPWNTGWGTTAYKVMVSDDLEKWYEVECGRIFDPGYLGYHAYPTPQWFTKPVLTRYIRVYPLNWNGYMGGRMSAMICSECRFPDCERNSLSWKQELQSNADQTHENWQNTASSYIVSQNGRYVAIMQYDGNFVVYSTDHYYWIWATHTSSGDDIQWRKPKRLVLQEDCNLVVYGKDNKPRWASNSKCNKPKRIDAKEKDAEGKEVTVKKNVPWKVVLTLQNDGNMVLVQGDVGAKREQVKLKQGAEKMTNETSIGDRTTWYLDRQTIDCGDKPIGRFKLRVQKEQIRYAYNCVEDGIFGAPEKLKSSDEDDGNGQIAYLDRLEVDCGMDRAISKIQLVRKPGNRLAYEYSCMDATDGNQLICRDARTKPESEAGGGRAIEFLDRHDIACEKNEVMQRFRMQREWWHGNMRYDYRCCKEEGADGRVLWQSTGQRNMRDVKGTASLKVERVDQQGNVQMVDAPVKSKMEDQSDLSLTKEVYIKREKERYERQKKKETEHLVELKKRGKEKMNGKPQKWDEEPLAQAEEEMGGRGNIGGEEALSPKMITMGKDPLCDMPGAQPEEAKAGMKAKTEVPPSDAEGQATSGEVTSGSKSERGLAADEPQFHQLQRQTQGKDRKKERGQWVKRMAHKPASSRDLDSAREVEQVIDSLV